MIDIVFLSSSESNVPSGRLEDDLSIVISWLELEASFPAKSTKNTSAVYVLSSNVSLTSIFHLLAVTIP